MIELSWKDMKRLHTARILRKKMFGVNPNTYFIRYEKINRENSFMNLICWQCNWEEKIKIKWWTNIRVVKIKLRKAL